MVRHAATAVDVTCAQRHARHYGMKCPLTAAVRAQVQYGDGDITVPHASLALCRGWGAAQGQGLPVFAASYPRLVHAMLTESEEAAEDVVGAVAGDTWPR